MSLDKALKDIQKRYGGVVVTGAELGPVGVIPTGSLALDLALGVGGIPRGRITEIYGPEASGKSTLCLHIIAEAQKLGGVAAFIGQRGLRCTPPRRLLLRRCEWDLGYGSKTKSVTPCLLPRKCAGPPWRR